MAAMPDPFYRAPSEIADVRSSFMQISRNNERVSHKISALHVAMKHRDEITADHSMTVAHYCFLLAKRLDPSNAYLYYLGGLMHDCGKIAMKDDILKSPNPLEEWQMDLVQDHVRVGANLLAELSMPDIVVHIAQYHHERFDGSGYLYNLKGNQIPLCGRIAAIADMFSALIEDRPYKKGIHPKLALDVITQSKATFDPVVFESFHVLIQDEIINL